MKIIVRVLCSLFIGSYLFFEIYAASDNVGCPNRVFLGCVLRLKAQRVPFEKNILNVIFNIGSEARLMHTCKAYSEIMPCFRDKILECGNDKQRRMLNEVGKTLMFLCSPFSVERQKLLMKHQKCVGEILALPATVGCKLHDSYHGKQLLKCREACSQKPTDFTCMLKTWISEQNVCTLRDIHDKCGPEASLFYTDMQSTVFEPLFPVLCDFPPQVTASPMVFSSLTTPFSEILTTTQISPRTIISIPAPPNGNMIQPPRIRPFIRGNVKHKPVDTRPFPFWTPPLSTPKPELRSTWKSEYYGNQEYSVTVMPFTADPSPKHYPLVSLFKKILPGNLPEKFSFLFEKNEEHDKLPVIQKTDKPMPIAAKEIYEVNAITPTTLSTVSEEEITFINTHVSKDFPVTTKISLSSTTPLSVRESFTPLTHISAATHPSIPQLPVYTFTSKPKSNKSNETNLPPTPEKWRPWYLGGFSNVKSDAKFRIPLYHGA